MGRVLGRLMQATVLMLVPDQESADSRRLSASQGHTGSQWPRQDLNPDPGTPEHSPLCLTASGRKRSSFAF